MKSVIGIFLLCIISFPLFADLPGYKLILKGMNDVKVKNQMYFFQKNGMKFTKMSYAPFEARDCHRRIGMYFNMRFEKYGKTRIKSDRACHFVVAIPMTDVIPNAEVKILDNNCLKPICPKALYESKSEGWYNPVTGKLIRWDDCKNDNEAVCLDHGEYRDAIGWYSKKKRRLIKLDSSCSAYIRAK